MKRLNRTLALGLTGGVAVLGLHGSAEAAITDAFNPAKPTINSYHKGPDATGRTDPAGLMLLLDTSASMNFNAHQGVDTYGYHTDTSQCTTGEYDGYFNKDRFYTLQNDLLHERQYWDYGTGTGTSGSELNCRYMRRIDMARKALTGGTRASEDEISTPESNRKYMLRTQGGVYMTASLADEETGILGDIGSNVRLGLTITDPHSNGGLVVFPIGSSVEEITTYINNETVPYGGTPLAEALNTIRGYFAQSETDGTDGPRYYSPASPNTEPLSDSGINNAWTRFGVTVNVPELISHSYELRTGDTEAEYGKWDPFYNVKTGEQVICGANSVLIISDGEPMADTSIPEELKDTDGDNDTTNLADVPGDSDYLDDLAKELQTTDLRQEFSGSQLVKTHTVFLYGDAATDPHIMDAAWDGETLLHNTATNGGGVAQQASQNSSTLSSTEIADALQAVVSAVQSEGAGAGGSVALGSTSGEGAVYQTMYNPAPGGDATWIGDVQALLNDSDGNLREDTNNNQKLDLKEDLIVKLTHDDSGAVEVRYFQDVDGNGRLDESEETIVKTSSLSPDKVNFLWSAGAELTDPSARRLYSSIDGIQADFDDTFAADNYQYMFASGASKSFRDLNGDDVQADAADAQVLVNWIRGTDQDNLRSRSITHDDGTTGTWLLGDIIHSSPVVVAAPFESYDLRYNDRSYRKFKQACANRRQMVYVGGNDGVFHAFNAGFYDARNDAFHTGPRTVDEKGVISWEEDSSTPLGKEMWGYVPQNLLPHLPWLTSKEAYTHIFYNDLTPRVFEAKLWDEEDEVHVGGWGTLVLGGMRFGGGPIEVEVNGVQKTMRSAYYLFDVTDPEKKPVLMDEFTLDSDERFSFTTVTPAIAPVVVDRSGSTYSLDWYLVAGNGPDNLRGEGHDGARVVIRKFKNGLSFGQGLADRTEGMTPWEGGETYKKLDDGNFIGDPCAVDLQRGAPTYYKGAFTTDAVYFGTVEGKFGDTAGDAGIWWGKMWRMVIGGKAKETTEGPDAWETSHFYFSGKPIVSRPVMTVDNNGTPWLFFGSGRYFDATDAVSSADESIFGVKENEDFSGEITSDNLLDVTNAVVYTDGTVTGVDVDDENGDGKIGFAELVTAVDGGQGWKLGLRARGERVIDPPTLFAGALFVNGFIPQGGESSDCGDGSETNIYALYYKTGTAYKDPIIGTGTSNDDAHVNEETGVFGEKGGSGKVSVRAINVSDKGSEVKIMVGNSETEVTGRDGMNDTGNTEFKVSPPLPFKSHKEYWKNSFSEPNPE